MSTFRMLFGYRVVDENNEEHIHYITHIDVEAYVFVKDDNGAYVFYDEDGNEVMKYKDSSIVSVDEIA